MMNLYDAIQAADPILVLILIVEVAAFEGTILYLIVHYLRGVFKDVNPRVFREGMKRLAKFLGVEEEKK